MGKLVGVLFVLFVVVFGFAAYSVGHVTPEQDQVRAQAEATRLAIENEKAAVDLQVKQEAARARAIAAQGLAVGAAFALLVFLLALAIVVPLWLYNRASMAYAKQGLYPIVVRPGLRGVTIYDANRLPGMNPQVTSQAQAVQLAAALSSGDGLTATERSATMREIAGAFQPARSPALLDPPIVVSSLTPSHVERLLLKGGDDDDDR